jgi:uncharacterized protein (DUF305 family)
MMQKKTYVIGAILLLTIFLSIIVSFTFSNRDNNAGSMMHHLSSSQGKNLSGSDAMFLQMMIPHHEQAVLISELALDKSKNAKLLSLAAAIKSAQKEEILQMKKWLADDGLGEDPGHSMDSMGGMLTQEQISKLKSSTDKEFDRLFLTGMIAHHEGALQMVSMISESKDLNLKLFGESILKSQSEEISTMQDLLAKL